MWQQHLSHTHKSVKAVMNILNYGSVTEHRQTTAIALYVKKCLYLMKNYTLLDIPHEPQNKKEVC